MFSHEFVRNAWLAGTFIALACGTVGWFVVMRGQVFAGDALSHVAFVGAIAWILGIGVLLLAVLATSANGTNGLTTANTLFGSIYSLSAAESELAAALGVVVTVLVAAAARPLLISTLDPEMASMLGLPVRALGIAFLGALAIVTAESTQAVGALLLLGLIAAPAGAALTLTPRPYVGLALSGAIAVCAMWGGLALSYAVPSLPPSTAIIGLAATAYALAAVLPRVRRLSAGVAGRS